MRKRKAPGTRRQATALAFGAALFVLIGGVISARPLPSHSLLPSSAAFVSPTAAGGGNGTIYVGTYARNFLIVDEATFKVRDSIPVSIGIPYRMTTSADKKRLFAIDPAEEKFEIIDIATRKSLNVISFSKPGTRVRISGVNVDPLQRYALLIIKNYTKLADRYEIGRPVLVKYDLIKNAVTDTIKWPDGREREQAQIVFSPKGDLLYFFTNDGILVWDAATFKQLDKWDMSSMSLDEGLGRMNFAVSNDVYEEPGFYTGSFRMPDPVNHRQFIGLARIDLVNRKLLDYYTFGPSLPIGLRLAPGRQRAYGLASAVGQYTVYAFDLEKHQLISKNEFPGRPRMTLSVSTNGSELYISTAGSTIDRYEATTMKYIGTLNLGADMTGMEIVPASLVPR